MALHLLGPGAAERVARAIPADIGHGYTDAIFEHTSSPTRFFKAQIRWKDNGWDLDLKDGSRTVFREGFVTERPAQSVVTRIQG
ncbi:MAG TPA: hypothetical protein VFO67_18920 [Gemmatimonadales bacterium]|nr:hypothetical protein [Gemmatimonadales bacterium]